MTAVTTAKKIIAELDRSENSRLYDYILQMVSSAISEEREACAKIADAFDPVGHGGIAGAIATAVRARK